MKRILKLVKYPDPNLKNECVPVRDESNWEEIRTLADRMHLTMKVFRGIGLSAPQVGLKLQIFTMNMTGLEEDALTIINPKILAAEGKIDYREACLSFPGIDLVVPRYEKINVEYLNEWNEKQEKWLDGIESVCFQHERDHLGGIVFTERVSKLKKEMALKRFKKLGHL